MRTIKRFYISLPLVLLKEKLLHWASQFEEIAWMDSNEYPQKHTNYEAILAVDAFTSIKTDYDQSFKALNEYQQNTGDWIFGYLSYDLKNDVEALKSNNPDNLQFPDLYFFQPKKIFFITQNEIVIHYLNHVKDEIHLDWEDIINQKVSPVPDQKITSKSSIKIKLKLTKDTYRNKVNTMLSHIKRGDIYEANFCQEFYAENSTIDPLMSYIHLNKISKPPFATFFKMNHGYVLSASPERYLKKDGQTILSQPIKGTSRRSNNPKEDANLKVRLENDTKERSENIMIVDLVRNDLSKSAVKGSVQVEELCKVYAFKQVHQMISTIKAEIEPTTTPVTILRQTFPMGSMTGAPKIKAMQIIEALEESKRGLYSGSVGYFTPKGDFDFNVIIRSILYNESLKYISVMVGSAITAKSKPDKEYEECLLKAKAMRQVLETNTL